MLPGLPPNVPPPPWCPHPKTPRCRPARRSPTPLTLTYTEGLLPHRNVVSYWREENEVPQTPHPGQEGIDAGAKPTLSIITPLHSPSNTSYTPASATGQEEEPRADFPDRKRRLDSPRRGRHQETSQAETELAGLQTDAGSSLLSPPSSARRNFRCLDGAGLRRAS